MSEEIQHNYYKTACPDRYKLLKEFARENRSLPTIGEERLWQSIRNNQLGVRFRRQHPINDYIPDFICLSEKIIIEVDGEYHGTSEQVEEDTIRTHHLAKMGFLVLRFTNEEIYYNLEKVLNTIKQNLLAPKGERMSRMRQERGSSI